MGHIVSVVLDHLEFLSPEAAGLPVHGANLATSSTLRRFAQDQRLEALELFLPPSEMLDPERLQRAAHSVLPPERRGHGAVRFHPFHALPDVWSDGLPRILFTLDPEWIARDRYLRDRFAAGPMPVTCDTHALGPHRLWPPLARLADAPPVAYDSIVCISEACREALRRAFDGFLAEPGAVPPCRLDLLPRGVDTQFFAQTDPARRAEARRLMGLPERGQIALFLGRVTPYDKADLLPLLRAFARATDRRDDFLLIVGEENAPGYFRRLRESGDDLGLGERLILKPGVKGPLRPLYFSAADLFVFPGDSIQESFGNTVIEAMACGLPTIVSDWDGMRDLVVDGETGILVATWWVPGTGRIDALSPVTPFLTEHLFIAQSVWVDSSVLTEALRSLLTSPGTRERMGGSARRRAEQEYDWPVALNRWHALWSELLESAKEETTVEAEDRRRYARRLGLPTPYARIFSHYASGVLEPDGHSVRLSEAGWEVVEKKASLRFYDETLPILHQAVVDALFEALKQSRTEWIRVADLSEDAARGTGFGEEDVRLHIALLLKRDVLEMSSSSNRKPTTKGENAQ